MRTLPKLKSAELSYPQIRSKTLSGCLKPQRMPSPIYTMCLPTYTYYNKVEFINQPQQLIIKYNNMQPQKSCECGLAKDPIALHSSFW